MVVRYILHLVFVVKGMASVILHCRTINIEVSIDIFHVHWVAILLCHFYMIVHCAPVCLWIVSLKLVAAKSTLRCLPLRSLHFASICWLLSGPIRPIYSHYRMILLRISMFALLFKFYHWKLLLYWIAQNFDFVGSWFWICLLLMLCYIVLVLWSWFLVVWPLLVSHDKIVTV